MKHELDDLSLQRFVDGELSLPERQAVLARLDQHPQQWRRLALAYVEMQIWEEGFCTADGEAARFAAKATAARAPAWQPRTVLAMATSLLVACALGTWIGTAWRSLPSAAPQVAEGEAPEAKVQPSGDLVQDESSAPQSDTAFRMLRLRFDEVAEGSARTLDVPLIDSSQLRSGSYRYPAPAVPREVHDTLLGSGYQVNQSREFVPLRLEGGQQIMLPIDTVQVRYVGMGMYQ